MSYELVNINYLKLYRKATLSIRSFLLKKEKKNIAQVKQSISFE